MIIQNALDGKLNSTKFILALNTRFYESLGFLLLSPLVEILVGSAKYLSFLWGPIGLSVLAISPFWLVSIWNWISNYHIITSVASVPMFNWSTWQFCAAHCGTLKPRNWCSKDELSDFGWSLSENEVPHSIHQLIIILDGMPSHVKHGKKTLHPSQDPSQNHSPPPS